MKKIITTCLAVMMLLTLPFCSQATGIGVSINGVPVSFTQETGIPYIDTANRTQVPMRAVMESYGCHVTWDEATKTAVLTKDNKTVKVPIGKNYIEINGRVLSTDTAALIQSGRTYLPIRAVLEAFGGYVSFQNKIVTVDNTNSLLQVHFMDVGQGDSILIDIGDYEVLIDASTSDKGNIVVNNIKPFVDENLDLIIATHNDSDHIGGMCDVLNAFTVSRVIDCGREASTATYKKYQTAVAAENCTYESDDDMQIPLGNSSAVLTIIETGDSADNANDLSVISQLNYGTCSILFTGDMTENIEKTNLNRFSDIDVLKVGHHGSAKSSCIEFLNKVKPEYCVVSYGVGNSYGHPTADALSRIANIGAKILGTGKSGNITLSSNGASFCFDKSNYLTISDAGSTASKTTQDTSSENTSAKQETSESVTYPSAATTNAQTYIGNVNTKKYHYPSCSSVARMAEKNKILLTKDEAISDGYTPCLVCKP